MGRELRCGRVDLLSFSTPCYVMTCLSRKLGERFRGALLQVRQEEIGESVNMRRERLSCIFMVQLMLCDSYGLLFFVIDC